MGYHERRLQEDHLSGLCALAGFVAGFALPALVAAGCGVALSCGYTLSDKAIGCWAFFGGMGGIAAGAGTGLVLHLVSLVIMKD